MSRSSKQQFSQVARASGEPCYTDCNIKDNNLDDDNVNGDDGNKNDEQTCCTILHSSHTAGASLSLLKVIHLLLVSVA